MSTIYFQPTLHGRGSVSRGQSLEPVKQHQACWDVPVGTRSENACVIATRRQPANQLHRVPPQVPPPPLHAVEGQQDVRTCLLMYCNLIVQVLLGVTPSQNLVFKHNDTSPSCFGEQRQPCPVQVGWSFNSQLIVSVALDQV